MEVSIPGEERATEEELQSAQQLAHADKALPAGVEASAVRYARTIESIIQGYASLKTAILK